MPTWITDAHNNRVSIERWGSAEAAMKSLDTLVDCRDCSDCSSCSSCRDCSYCSYCSECHSSSDCHSCSDCSYCSSKVGSQELLPVPVIKGIHQRVYAAASQPCALNMCNWHDCDTIHCRAGWVVHLAGEAGYALESQASPLFAALQIYKASGCEISPCRFFDTNEESLADMKRLADEEAECTST